jgi:RNA polymerase sigma factor (sigma-70 family)
MTGDSTSALVRQFCGTSPDAHTTDGQLLGRFATDRDETAFAELVRRHGSMVLGVCRRIVGNAHDADDVFQATFLVLARKARGLVAHTAVGPWLYGVAHRAALKARTTAARRRAKEAAAARPEGAEPMGASSDVLVIIEQELDRLPKRYREPLVLCVLCGRPRKEVARKLGVPEGTLASRLAKAREMLADRLQRRGVIAPTTVAAGCAVPVALADAAVRAATGTVPVAVGRIASEVTRFMFLNKLRTGALVLVAVALASAAGAAALVSARANAPESVPPATPNPPVPLVVKAAAPAQDPPWKKEFDRIYKLKDGEVLKRVAPPFPDCRLEYIKNSPRLAPGTHTVPIYMALRIHEKETKGQLHLWGFGGGEPSVSSVMWHLGVPMGEVEADPKLLQTPVGGDFVYRGDVPVEKLVVALERILREECKLAVRLTFREVEREVVVASGTLKIVPLAGQEKNHVEVFGKEIGKGEAWGSSKDLHGFLLDLGGFLGRRIVNEAKSGKDEVFTYGLSVRQSPRQRLATPFDIPSPDPLPKFDPAIEAEDRDPKLVLANVAKQTGLTFTTAKRKVQVLFVEKDKE